MSRRFSVLAAVATLFTLVPLESSATTITFNNDAPGVYPNLFASVDSPLVLFSEVGAGAVGLVGVNQFQSTSNVLSTGAGGGGPDEFLMEFLVPVNMLSFDIGHSAGLTNVDGWLRVFNGATLVSESRVPLDADTLFNQVIAYSGAPITSARYALVATGSTNLGLPAESMDNVTFNAVPEPGTLLLIGSGLVGVAVRKKLLS